MMTTLVGLAVGYGLLVGEMYLGWKNHFDICERVGFCMFLRLDVTEHTQVLMVLIVYMLWSF